MMVESGVPQKSTRIPAALIAAVVLMAVQALANSVVGVLMLAAIHDAVSHGMELEYPGLAHFLAYASFAVTALLLLCGVMLLAQRERRWPLAMTLVIEGLLVLSYVAAMGSGEVPAGIFPILPVLIAILLLRPSTTRWFAHR